MRAITISVALLVYRPALALDPPHEPASSIGCADCHLTSATKPAWYTAAPDPADPDTQAPLNRLCWTCHQQGGTAPFVRTHSRFAITGTAGFSIECRTCHDPHFQRQPRTWGDAGWLVTGTIASLAGSTLTAAGPSFVPGAYVGRLLVPSTAQPRLQYRIVANDTNSLTVRGTIDVTVAQPGGTFGVAYGKGIRARVADRDVRLFARNGSHSLADGDSVYDGVCEVCHTSTAHHRNDATGDHAHFAAQQCVLCHQHRDGFKPSASSLTDCVHCHDVARGPRRQIVDSAGDGTGTGGDFRLASHHVQASTGIPTNADCQVCHDTSLHGGGVVMLRDADTGGAYPYNPENPVTAEAFCLSCHDANGAAGGLAPFSDAKTLGSTAFPTAATIEASWSRTYGHQRVGLTCLGSGAPGTGCHASGHGSTNSVLLARPVNLPNTTHGYFRPEWAADFELCFGCHASYQGVTKEDVFGVRHDGAYDHLPGCVGNITAASCTQAGCVWANARCGAACVSYADARTCGANHCFWDGAHCGPYCPHCSTSGCCDQAINDGHRCAWSGTTCDDTCGVAGDPGACTSAGCVWAGGACVEVLGPTPPVPYYVDHIVTRFRDRNGTGSGKPYDDTPTWYAGAKNLHLFHVSLGTWTFRGQSWVGIDCTACHDVHGSSSPVGWTYDALGYAHFDSSTSASIPAGDAYGAFSAPATDLDAAPFGCASFNCHEVQAPGHAWFDPAGE